MKNLEGMAREIFNRYAERAGVRANWNYLSDSRKAVWMQDILLLSEYFTNELKNSIKPLPGPTKTSTSYEAGFASGVYNERVYFTNLIEGIHDKLTYDYISFENKQQK